MSGKVKKILIAVVLFLGIGGAGAYFLLPSTINWAKETQELTASMQKAMGIKMVITGTPVFSMRPTPTLKFKRVVLKNPTANGTYPDMLVAPSMEVTLDSGALFRRQVVIKKITFVKPELFLEKSPEGQWNLSIGFFRGASPTEKFHFESILISEGVVNIKKPDQAEKKWDNFNVEVYADTLQGPFSMEGTAKFFNDNWRFSIKIPKLQPNTRPLFTTYLIHVPSETILSFSGGFSEAVSDTWDGSITYDIRKTDMAFKMFFPNMNLPADFFAPLSGNMTATYDMRTQAFSMRDILFKYGESSASGQLALKCDSVAKEEDGGDIFSSELSGSLNVTKFSAVPFEQHAKDFAKFIVGNIASSLGDVKTNIKVNLDTFEHNRDNVRYVKFDIVNPKNEFEIANLEASFPGNTTLQGSAHLVLSGEKPVLQGTFKLEADNFGTMLRWLGIPVPAEVPQNLLRKLEMQSLFALNEQALRFTETDLKLDLTEGKGAAIVSMNANGGIYVSADVNELNIDAYFPEKKVLAKAFTDELIKKSPAEKIRFLFEKLGFLNNMNLRLNILSQLVTWADMKMQNAVVKMQVQNAVMMIEEISSTDFLKSSIKLNGRMTGFGSVPTFPDDGVNVAFETRQLKAFSKEIGLELPKNFERAAGSDSVLLKGAFAGTLDKLNTNMFVSFGKFSFDANGSITSTPSGVDFEAAVSRLTHDNFRNFARFFTEKYRPIAQKPAEITFIGTVSKKADNYHIEMAPGTQLDAQNVTGFFDIVQEPQKPMRVTSELTFPDSLDISPLLPDMKIRIPSVQTAGERKMLAFLGDRIEFQKVAPDFSFLGNWSADVKFKAANLLWEDTDFKNAEGTLSLDAEKIQLKLDSALWNDANLDAQVQLGVKEGMSLDVQMTLSALKASEGVFGAQEADISFDNLNLSMTAQGSGATASDVFSALLGKGQMHIDGAVLYQIDLKTAEKLLSDRKLPEQAVFDKTLVSGQTVFEKISAPVELASNKITLMPIEMTAKEKTYTQNKAVYDVSTQVLDVSFEIPVSENEKAPLLKKNITRDDTAISAQTNGLAVLNFFINERKEEELKLQKEEEAKKQQELIQKQQETEKQKEQLRPIEQQMALEAGDANEKYETVSNAAKEASINAAQVFQMSLDVKAVGDFWERVKSLLKQEEISAEEIKSVEDYFGGKIPELKQKIGQMYDVAMLALSRQEIAEINAKAKETLALVIQKSIQNKEMTEPAQEAKSLFKSLEGIVRSADKEMDMTRLTIFVGEASALSEQIRVQNEKLDKMIKERDDRIKAEEEAKRLAEEKRKQEEEKRKQEEEKAAAAAKAAAEEAAKTVAPGTVIRRSSGTKVLKIQVGDDVSDEPSQTPTIQNDGGASVQSVLGEASSDSSENGTDKQSESSSSGTGMIIRRN